MELEGDFFLLSSQFFMDSDQDASFGATPTQEGETVVQN